MIDGNEFIYEGKSIPNANNGDESEGGGKLWLGFSNPRSEDIL